MDQNLINEDFAIITIKRVFKILQEKLTMSMKLGKVRLELDLIHKMRKIEKMKFVKFKGLPAGNRTSARVNFGTRTLAQISINFITFGTSD